MQPITPVLSIFPQRVLLGPQCHLAQRATLHDSRGMSLCCAAPFLSCSLDERIGCLVPDSQDLRCQLFLGIVWECHWLSVGRSWDPQGIIVSLLLEGEPQILLEADHGDCPSSGRMEKLIPANWLSSTQSELPVSRADTAVHCTTLAGAAREAYLA